MMTSEIIPKEKLSAYQRWEMDSLETLDSIRKEPKVDLASENNGQEDGLDQIKWPTEEEIAAVFQDAKETGYAAGYQAGNTAGYAEGRQAAEAEVQAEVSRMHALLSSLDEDLHQMDQQVAGGLLDLAIALAQKMVTQALIIKPELIIPIVQEAIRNLPNAKQHPRLYLHPDDAKLVHLHLEKQLAQDGWSIREDERLSRGGCRIEASGSEIDGSIEVRWHKILATIGRDDSWLEKKD